MAPEVINDKGNEVKIKIAKTKLIYQTSQSVFIKFSITKMEGRVQKPPRLLNTRKFFKEKK